MGELVVALVALRSALVGCLLTVGVQLLASDWVASVVIGNKTACLVLTPVELLGDVLDVVGTLAIIVLTVVAFWLSLVGLNVIKTFCSPVNFNVALFFMF